MLDSRMRFTLTSDITKRYITVTIFGEASQDELIENKGSILDVESTLEDFETTVKINLIDGQSWLTIDNKICSYEAIALWICEKTNNAVAVIIEDDLGNAGRYVKDSYLERREFFGNFENEL